MKGTSMRPHYRSILIFVIALLICNARVLAAAEPDAGKVTTWLGQPLTAADARHLISRTGFGVSAPELIALQDLSRGEAVDLLISGFRNTVEQAMPPWTRDTAPVFWTRQDLSADEKRRFDRKRDSELAELRQWWVDTLLTTSSPQTERMVLFWHDHFATSYHSVNRQSIAMARQNQTFRELGMGDFKTLLRAMIRDPALLNYLDNLSNRKESPNENLARELLELFTLGEGNYREQTVRDAARALTGFNVSQNNNLSFEYQTWSHDTGRKTLFGKTGNYDSDDLVDLILEQDALAPFIANKFWHAFVADHPPSEKQLRHLATAFKNNDYNITALYRATLESEAFWSDLNRASLVKSPAQLIIGFARAVEYPKRLNQQIPGLMALSGMDLFAPPNVAGWNEGAAWITSGRLLNRYNAIDVLADSNKEAMTSTQTVANSMMNMTGDRENIDRTMTMNANIMTAKNIESEKNLKIQMAGEDYRGSVNYRVELLNANNKTLWNSGNQSLPGGHDTRKYGRITNPQNLSWQTISFNIDKSTTAEAQFLQVHFLNDDGGDDGDRNMYVNGAEFGNQWVDSSSGTQISTCAPSSAADAGNLYCNGTVNLKLQNPSATQEPVQPRPNHIQASSIHIQWVRWQESSNNLDVTLTLQNLKSASDFFPVFSFHLKSVGGGKPRLQLSTYSCWPDCIKQWPDCSWKDKLDPSRQSLIFPLSGAADNTDYQCHADSVTSNERTLINQLIKNAPALLNAAANTHREFSGEQKKALAQWQKLFTQYQTKFNASFTDLTTNGIDINEQWQRSEPERQTAESITPAVHSLARFNTILRHEGLTLSQLLLPGLDQKLLSGFEHMPQESAPVQLQMLITSPAFQLH